ncbi:MAG: ArgE/DapE family deacylase [Candidatus Paceibacterota bacterium]|jgi:succinyl-diaminopimelate desuccinylase
MEITELIKKLIEFKTVNGKNDEFAACICFIKDYFKPQIESGKIYVVEYEKNGLHSIVFSSQKNIKPDIILNGHIDVVNAEEKDFTPIIKSGKLFGRGAADMKSQIATLMHIFKNIVESEEKKSVALMLTSDEELSGGNGVGYLLNEIGYRCKVAIVPDGGHNFEMIVKEKGGFWIKVSASGKSAHGSRTWLGENAVLKLMTFFYELEEIFPPLKKTKKLYQDGVSINLGVMNGGKSINSVPDRAEMFLDIRYSEKMHKSEIIKTLKKLSKKHKLKFEVTDVVEMLETDPQDPYLKKFKNIARKTIYKPIVITKASGASDARFFSAKGIPVIIMTPNCGNKHGKNEWVEIKSIEKFYDILIRFINEI